jgi:hypothetical protein
MGYKILGSPSSCNTYTQEKRRAPPKDHAVVSRRYVLVPCAQCLFPLPYFTNAIRFISIFEPLSRR